MNSRRIQINDRKVISLLLAALILVLAATPALAWAPEDRTKFQSPHAAIVQSTEKASVGQGMRLASPAPATLQLRPSLARAE